MTPLLSQQLMHLSPSILSPEVATQRARLLRRLRGSKDLQAVLESWSKALEHERALVAQGKDPTPEDEKVFRQRELLARRLAREMERMSRRIATERPHLDGYTELLSHLKSPAPYIPEPCPYEPFEPRNEDNDPDYAKLLKDAQARSIVKAQRTFVYQESVFKRSMALLAGLAGMVLALSGRLGSWSEPSTGDALMLLGFNLILSSGVMNLHISRKKAAAFRAHHKSSLEQEEAAARREIEYKERARLSVFLENSRRRREAYDATDSERRATFERQEAQRIELVRRVITGQEMPMVLRSLLPLKLAVPCAASHRILPDGRLEVQVVFPVDLLLPPSIDWRPTGSRPSPTQMDREIESQILPLAAALAVRHMAELFFHIPTLKASRVFVMRPAPNGTDTLPLVQVEADRRAMITLNKTGSPLDLLRSMRSRLFFEHVGDPAQQRAAS